MNSGWSRREPSSTVTSMVNTVPTVGVAQHTAEIPAAKVVKVPMRRCGVWWNFMDDDRWARVHVEAKPEKMPRALAPHFAAEEYCKMLLEIDALFKARADREMCVFNFLFAITLMFCMFCFMPWMCTDRKKLKRESDAILEKYCSEKGLKGELFWPEYESDAQSEVKAVTGNELRFTLPSETSL